MRKRARPLLLLRSGKIVPALPKTGVVYQPFFSSFGQESFRNAAPLLRCGKGVYKPRRFRARPIRDRIGAQGRDLDSRRSRWMGVAGVAGEGGTPVNPRVTGRMAVKAVA